MIWLASDWHLGHDKLVDLCHRPPGFSQLIISNLIKTDFQRGDTLINLGDVYLGKEGERYAERVFDYLDGMKTVLIQGNHDAKRLDRLLKMGWSWVCESTAFTYHGKRLLLTHEPVAEFAGDFNIHGHLHQIDGHRGGVIRDDRHILLSCELMGYRPIPLARLIEIGNTPAWASDYFVAADLNVGRPSQG